MTDPDLIDLYVIDLDVSAKQLQSHRLLLNPAEAARADRFARGQHASRWTVCHAMLRKILANYCNTAPETLLFSEEGNGKPLLAKVPGNAELHFNLSHSEAVALIAVTSIGPIGVDIEYERNLRDWEAISCRFFSPAEQAELATVSTDERRHAFYACWTRKEAVIKATGEGLSAKLDAFDVSLSPDRDARVCAYHDSARAGRRWQLHHLQPHPGYVGAVAIRHPTPVRIACHTPPANTGTDHVMYADNTAA